MTQLYFCRNFDSETAYDLATLKGRAKRLYMNQITVTKAVPDPFKDHFYCKEFDYVGVKSDGECGKICDGYTPKNGKSGMCRHQAKCYEPTGEPITIKIK
jgi:hypothetical protein